MPKHDLADLPNLLRSAREDGASAHAVLLRVQADLFVGAMSHSPMTIGAFETFALGAIPLVDEPDLLVVAERLAACAETPPAVIAALLARGGLVAAAVARCLSRMDDADMEAIASSGLDVMAEAVAGRPDLTTTAILALLERDTPALNRALAANQRLHLDRPALERLLARARHDHVLAQDLADRADLSAVDKACLYPEALAETRMAILKGVAALAGLDGRPAMPAGEPDALARLVALARARETDAFATAVAEASGLDQATIDRMLGDRSGESLALLLTAIGMNAMDAAAIFLNREPAISHSAPRVFALVDQVRDTDRAVAARVVAAIAGLERVPERQVEHQPFMAPSGVRAGPGATLSRRPAVPGQRPAMPRREA